MTKIVFSSALRFAALAVPVALIACTSGWMQMPTGYTYHNEIYKSVPGPEASPPAKILQTGDKTPSGMIVMQQESVALNGGPDANGNYPDSVMCSAADELISRLLRNFGRPMEPTLVPPMSPLAPCLVMALQRGQVPIAMNPGDGPFVIEHTISGGSASITFLSNHDPVVSESGAQVQGMAPAMAPASDMPPPLMPMQ